MGDKAYGVIAEFKIDGALIMEAYPMTYDEARERMLSLRSSSDVIRVAMFRMEFANGHPGLIPKKETE